MQMFGCGITTMDTLLGMLGLGVHCGSHQCWSEIATHIGIAQQKVTDEIQKINLQNKMTTMQERA